MRRCALGAGISLLMLVPCVWLPHIASADLASHAYNAWLATLVEKGEIQGLYIASQRTNIAFDWALQHLMPVVGPDAAQVLVVGSAVLLMFWAVFFFLREAGRRITPWHLLPSVAMLCYGFVFHVGLFNFYLSLGCSILALALIWRPSAGRICLAAPVAALGAIAHALPVGWMIAVAVYAALARRLRPRDRLYITAVVIGLVIGAGVFVQRHFTSRWGFSQILYSTGADQALVHGDWYAFLGALWLVWWVLLFGLLIRRRGWVRTVTSIPFQLVLLSGAGLIAIPRAIFIPGYSAGFQLLVERMSLTQGIFICLLLAGTAAARATVAIGCAMAVLFFGSIYQDDRRLVLLEEDLTAALSALPPKARVVGALCYPGLRMNYAYHLLDRACIGRCFSYANFEPSSGQFRLRAKAGNDVVVDSTPRANEFEYDGISVRPEEAPLYQVSARPGQPVQVRLVQAGERIPPPCPEPER